MIPVDQTEFGEKGNCFSACVASILEVPLDGIPNFCANPADWFERFVEWCEDRGLGVIEVCRPEVIDMPGVYYIASGKSERGYLHATVWIDGKMMHDPHPDKTGIESCEFFTFLVADPKLST